MKRYLLIFATFFIALTGKAQVTNNTVVETVYRTPGATQLADAMECRCYHGGEGRTRLNVMKWHASDVIYTLLGVVLCVGLVLLNQIQLGYVMN